LGKQRKGKEAQQQGKVKGVRKQKVIDDELAKGPVRKFLITSARTPRGGGNEREKKTRSLKHAHAHFALSLP